MKTFITTFVAAFLCLVSTAQADSFTIHQHKNWTVSWNDFEGEQYCSAEVSGSGVELNIDASNFTGLTVWIIEDERNWIPNTGVKLYAFIDTHPVWEIYNAQTENTFVWFNIGGNSGTKFLKQIGNGQKIYFDYNEKGSEPAVWDVWFSLAGSTAAILALVDCVDKLP